MLTPATIGRYISIKADGKFHEKVSPETDGAVRREYETSDGTKGEKWELLYKDISGLITNVRFEDGDFGENLLITITDGEEVITLSQGVATSFGEDLLKKLPNINFAAKVQLSPYSFENEKGKQVQGVNIYQQSDKVMNFFWDAENKLPLHHFPAIDKKEDETWSKDEWKAHFLKVRIFLTKYNKEHIVPIFEQGAPKAENPAVQYPQEEINPEDIPF